MTTPSRAESIRTLVEEINRIASRTITVYVRADAVSRIGRHHPGYSTILSYRMEADGTHNIAVQIIKPQETP